MDTALHRIEALPGAGRYAVTFRRTDGAEQTATISIAAGARGATTAADTEIEVAQASLPPTWRSDGNAFAMLVVAVRAVDGAARFAPPELQLVDVGGGWDVSLGNVVLDADGSPTCTAHGAMSAADRSAESDPGDGAQLWVCAECGAQAGLHS